MSETFAGINALAFMGALLVVAVVLRARFTSLQIALLPASLIGGAALSLRPRACVFYSAGS